MACRTLDGHVLEYLQMRGVSPDLCLSLKTVLATCNGDPSGCQLVYGVRVRNP